MIKLFIDEQLCEADLSKVSLPEYHHTDLVRIDSGREGHHLRLKLPSTPETDRLFCNAADMQSAERFNDEWHKARLEVDGHDLFVGTAFFDGVEIEDGATCYCVELVGGATQWAERAAKQMFNQIGLEYAANLTMLEILDSWSSDSPVKFLPVQRTSEQRQNGETTVATPEKILTPENYRPFISVEALCRRIFEGAGYRVESRFFESDEFRSLYIGGAYPATDIDAKMQRMDFFAGRTSSVTATANYAGRVYASPLIATSSLGNIVDQFVPEIISDNGNVISTEFFSKNNCLRINSDGVLVFQPLTSVNVGFEYTLKFACDYRMESRIHLHSFDSVYVGGKTFPFKLTNCFRDRRDQLQPGYEYRFVNFDYSEDYSYRLRYKVGTTWNDWVDIASNTVLVITPKDIKSAQEISLWRAPVDSSTYSVCSDDWALYSGHVGYKGRIEAELTLRTPAETVTPTSLKYFTSVFFDGGEPGESLTLLSGTTLRPIFTSTIGYGSRITFEDVAHLRIRQITLLDAVRQMFNLRFYTDERRKIVYIEPYEEFVCKDELFDWSDRIDYGQPVTIEELSREVHEQRLLGYLDADTAVREYNTENDTQLGEWSFELSTRGAIQGMEELRSPLFMPTISRAGVYVNAESALVMHFDDEQTESEEFNMSARIVRFVGMHPLEKGDKLGYPYSKEDYPLAAFHFVGDEHLDGFTLCFEDRDGCRGLHTYYDRQFAEEAECRKVTLSMQIAPDEYENLFRFVEGAPSIRSLFVLKINGVAQRYRLHSLEDYDPEKSTAKCVFVQMNPLYE